jgi:hypothetical protein
MTQPPAGGKGDEPGGPGERTRPPGPAQTEAMLQDLAALLQADLADSTPAALQPWPDRLQASAAALCQASLRIRSVLLDERFSLLTDPSLTSEPALAAIREFNNLLEAALTALIDLTGYENPDQEYPDLTSWFEFRCPNVIYSRRTHSFRIEEPGQPP